MSLANITMVLAAVCFVAMVLTVAFGDKIEAALKRRKEQKALRQENAKPVLVVNGGTHPNVGRMKVVVWANDFYQFAAEQTRKGSHCMYYAPQNMPAGVFTDTGYMPDGNLATGTIYLFENAFQFYRTRVRVENNSFLFIPQFNEKYASLDWQKRNCGIIPSFQWDAYRFFSPAITSKAA